MRRYRRSQMLRDIAYCFFVFLVVDFRPLVRGSFFKLVASVVLACLLAFVVVHSANICRLVVACLTALPASLFRLAVARRWPEGSQTTIAVPNKPSLSTLFQRPPPTLA